MFGLHWKIGIAPVAAPVRVGRTLHRLAVFSAAQKKYSELQICGAAKALFAALAIVRTGSD